MKRAVANNLPIVCSQLERPGVPSPELVEPYTVSRLAWTLIRWIVVQSAAVEVVVGTLSMLDRRLEEALLVVVGTDDAVEAVAVVAAVSPVVEIQRRHR